MAGKKKESEEESGGGIKTPYDPTAILDEVEKKFKVSGGQLDPEVQRSSAVSTGLLADDLILSGGIYPGGWYTLFGDEQSSKSTHIMTILGEAFNNEVPIIMFWDYEGSTSPEYMEDIFGDRLSTSQLFGVRNNDGSWAVKPRIRYYDVNEGEKFFNAVSKMLKSLPDKRYINGQWYYLFENTKENTSKYKGMHKSKLSSKLGKLAVPAEDGGTMQALILTDSYPAMLPAEKDVDDENNQKGKQASMFSENINKVAGKLRSKHSTVIGVNQIRLQPMAWGNPEYEPGGQALKFFSDGRIRLRPVSVPHGKGQYEQEDSVLFDEGEDTYRYIKLKVHKNKLGANNLEAIQRLWVQDPEGKGHGVDPVWDTFQFLKMTGQLTGNINKLSIYMPDLQLENISFFDFKRLILFKGKSLKKVCKRLGLTHNPRIRKKCFEQIRSGNAVDMMFQTMHGWTSSASEDLHEGDEEDFDEVGDDVEDEEVDDEPENEGEAEAEDEDGQEDTSGEESSETEDEDDEDDDLGLEDESGEE